MEVGKPAGGCFLLLPKDAKSDILYLGTKRLIAFPSNKEAKRWQRK
jgi:hypothetical protein